MSFSTFNFWLNLVGVACWGVCFWWMYRISAKQNSLLDRLTEQTQRIEKFARLEHELIQEVHPKVGEIRDGMEEMMAVVKENTDATEAQTASIAAAAPKRRG